MSLLVVGSIALDSVQTPTESRDNVLGGSAVYFSYAASYFTSVSLVGVVGEDWPDEHTELLRRQNIDTSGLQVVTGRKTFRWKGKYFSNMNDRETLEVHLNVFEDFDPKLPHSYRDTPYVFLANGSPKLQLKVLAQLSKVKLCVADTMDLWIREEHDELLELLRKIDGLVLNDAEAKLLTDDENLISAGKKVQQMGPRFVVVKKGEHGSLYFSDDAIYALPAYPTAKVVDPTGAGDSFAGGMMGYLVEQDKFDSEQLKKALAYGTVVASFNVEDFSLDRMQAIGKPDVDHRFSILRSMLDLA